MVLHGGRAPWKHLLAAGPASAPGPWAFGARRAENAPLATHSDDLKGGVRDPRLVGTVYIED